MSSLIARSAALLAAAPLAFWSSADAQERRESRTPTAEIALSNDTLQVRYMSDARAVGVDGGRARVAGAFLLSEQRDTVFSGSLLFPATVEDRRWGLLFGPQLYAALLEDENDDVLGMSVGGEARFVINRRSNLAIVGHAYYAPDILTFGSADAVTDLGVRAEIRLAERLTGFGGMRWFEFDLTDGAGERTLQEELFAGVGWRF
jgi:hypothetical protein